MFDHVRSIHITFALDHNGYSVTSTADNKTRWHDRLVKSMQDVHIVYGFYDGIAGVVLRVSAWEVQEQVKSCYKHV